MPRIKQATSRKKASAENGNQNQASVTVLTPAAATGRDEEVRRRAYELYEARGRQDGAAEEDWFRAEQEVLNGRRSA